MIYIPLWVLALIGLITFIFGAFLGTINSTSGVTSGEIKQESCAKSVLEISRDSPLGDTPSH